MLWGLNKLMYIKYLAQSIILVVTQETETTNWVWLQDVWSLNKQTKSKYLIYWFPWKQAPSLPIPSFPALTLYHISKRRKRLGAVRQKLLNSAPSFQQHKIFAVPTPISASFLPDSVTEMLLPKVNPSLLPPQRSVLYIILSLIQHLVNTHYVPDTIFDSGEMMGNKTKYQLSKGPYKIERLYRRSANRQINNFS